MEGNDNKFVKKLRYGKYSEDPEAMNKEFEPANPDDTLVSFYGSELGFVDCFFDSDFDIELETDPEEILRYKNTTSFYLDKFFQGKKAITYASQHNDNVPKIEKNEPQGELKVYPNQNAGLIFGEIHDSKTGTKVLRTVFPFITDGYEYECSIQNVFLGYYGYDAQINAFIDEDENLLLTFYDIHYLDNKNFYNNKDTFEFVLMGFASDLEKIDNEDMVSMEKPDYLEGSENEEYDIYTIVRAIEEYKYDINGEKIWKMTIVLGFTPDGEDIPLNIFVPNGVLSANYIPEVGDNIYVNVNIYGFLRDIEKNS